MLMRKADGRADGHLDVLGSIPPAYRQAVLEQCERRHVAKGKTVWSQGEPADCVALPDPGTGVTNCAIAPLLAAVSANIPSASVTLRTISIPSLPIVWRRIECRDCRMQYNGPLNLS